MQNDDRGLTRRRSEHSQIVFLFRTTVAAIIPIKSCLPLSLPFGTFSMLVSRTKRSPVEQLSVFLPILSGTTTRRLRRHFRWKLLVQWLHDECDRRCLD